jgi:hypothetical protein
MRLSELIADRVDLAIDFLTLGQYGLEETSAPDAGCEGGGCPDHGRGCREALPPVRGRGCGRLGRRPAPAAA